MIVDLRDADAATCGAKAAALGQLLTHGLPVPDGFVIPFADLDASTPDPVRPDPLRPAVVTDIDAWLGAFGLRDAPVAVRSSANTEDTAAASGAGQHTSTLAIRGVAGVIQAVADCVASTRTAPAAVYRQDMTPGATPRMAVMVQRLVDAQASGVMFTAGNPDGATRIESSWGLGPLIVEGAVTPDTVLVSADGEVSLTSSGTTKRMDRLGDQLVVRDIPEAERDRPSLPPATAVELAALGARISTIFGCPQDIEWAWDGDKLWVLQSRPVTRLLPSAPTGAFVPDDAATLRGTPASSGRASGPARVVRTQSDFAPVRPGDILVCPTTDPAWTPLFRLVAGVVTELGGVLSHAAIVAREYGIPAIVNAAGATGAFIDGQTISVDAGTGTVVVIADSDSLTRSTAVTCDDGLGLDSCGERN